MAEWFDKEAGNDLMQSQDDPCMALLCDVPNWVRLPAELGGGQRRVEDAFIAPCPVLCGVQKVKHLVVGDVSVAECSCRGFLWYRTPSPEEK